MKIRNHKLEILIVVAMAVSSGRAQVAAHAPTQVAQPTTVANASVPATGAASPNVSPFVVSNKPVVRINGTELTDRDLLREMMTIFPYARQHNGFPRGEEQKIRTGAMKMIEFEELVYQEAERRGMTVPAPTLQKAQADFRAQFPDDQAYNEYLKTEMQGSKQVLRKNIRRSLLIEELLKAEVEDKSKVSLAEVRAYYDKNPKLFLYGEKLSIQSISIMPSDKGGDEGRKAGRKRAEEACSQAKATKSYEEFGLLAEKISEDDFRVNMGDHREADAGNLPPEIVNAAQAMQPGQVSGLLQLGNFYTCFRLNEHKPAGKLSFAQAKDRLRQDLQKERYEKLRAGLDKKLRQNAKVEEL